MNRIDQLFSSDKKQLLSVYFTAGYPSTDSTIGIISTLAEAGADMIEIGIPFSDPLADGPVIQKSSSVALKNGMNLKLLFKQIAGIRKEVNIPLLMMGYLNPVLRFGIENFCRKCAETGIDGIILPDLPPDIYIEQFRQVFIKYSIYNILLISPNTSQERIRFIDGITEGFLYVVSSSSVTGIKGTFTDEQREYFRKIKGMNLTHPFMIGFGISSHESYLEACRYASGVIVGSAFIKILGENGFNKESIKKFIKNIKEQVS
ncbi:MAG: tryptophan synthase subunit alpha [Bacteroidales bacterium]